MPHTELQVQCNESAVYTTQIATIEMLVDKAILKGPAGAPNLIARLHGTRVSRVAAAQAGDEFARRTGASPATLAALIGKWYAKPFPPLDVASGTLKVRGLKTVSLFDTYHREFAGPDWIV